eukprot:6208630-Pleurochrysis_carterae.AAC.2
MTNKEQPILDSILAVKLKSRQQLELADESSAVHLCSVFEMLRPEMSERHEYALTVERCLTISRSTLVYNEEMKHTKQV